MVYDIQSRILPTDVPGKESRVYRKPVGVVGIISPWNWPLHLTMRSLAPALAAGNAVVIKPASDTPVTGGLHAARIFEEAGLPAGAVNVIAGSGDPFVVLADAPLDQTCVFTRDLERGARFAQRMVSGMAHVNDQPVNDLPNCPFGGEKNSGVGHFGGEWAIEAFTTDQWLTVQHEPRVFPKRAGEVSGNPSAGG